MENKEQLYSYKGINKQPTIKLPQETTRNQCSKTQTNPEKAAVQKGNPTQQGLKHGEFDWHFHLSKSSKKEIQHNKD